MNCFYIYLQYIKSFISMVKKTIVKEETFKKTLKNMPRHIRDFVFIEQKTIESKNKIIFSFESTLYKLIESHPKYINHIAGK